MRVAFGLCAVLVCGPALAAGVNARMMKDWTIVAADDAIPSERHAAAQFQGLFKAVTGIELPIAEAPPGKHGNVFIGYGPAMQASPAGFDVSGLGEEGLRIRIRKRNIAIAGGRPRGTLYGVYEFFERYFGVRFLTFDHTYIPEGGDTVSLPRGQYSYVPPFSFRWSYYCENAIHPAFAARLRVNTVSDDETLGGKTRQNLISHSLYRWINPAKYGETHPEYFALVAGERKLDVFGGGPEPCVTNPDVIDIVTEGVLAQLAANPNVQNISVSQNDNDAYCRCETCKAINQREGTPMGAHLALVNAVAERVEQEHPDVKVGTLAYWYTRKAPKTIKPRANVQIQLCSIECCTLHAIDDPKCPKNQKFCKDMRAWKKICKDIWVWNYNTNFHCYDLPFPNLRSIGANVRFFLKNHVKGLFMQANGNGTSGEMSDLRNYVIARCMWHPGQDSWPLVEEFCRLHYQEAAPPILACLTMLHDNAEERGLHPGCFPSAEQVGLNPQIAQRAFDCFAEALALARTDAVRARVEKASICAYKAMLVAGAGRWRYADGVCRRELPENYEDAPARYVELAQKHNLTMASERMPAQEYFDQVRRGQQFQAVRIENDVWRLTVLPGENGKLVEMLHKPTGRTLLAGMTHADILRGTHEDMGLRGFEDKALTGFHVDTQGTALTLRAEAADGTRFERRIALKPDAPGKVWFESTLTHNGSEPKKYQFKAHPEFDPGSRSDDVEIVSVYIKDKDWARFTRDWEADEAPERDLLKTAKGGGFAFYNHEAGFGACMSYDPAQVERPYLWWHPPGQQINLELLTPTVELKPGDKMALAYQFEFLSHAPE